MAGIAGRVSGHREPGWGARRAGSGGTDGRVGGAPLAGSAGLAGRVGGHGWPGGAGRAGRSEQGGATGAGRVVG